MGENEGWSEKENGRKREEKRKNRREDLKRMKGVFQESAGGIREDTGIKEGKEMEENGNEIGKIWE